MHLHCITNFTELGGAEGALIRVINKSQSTPIEIVSLMAISSEMKAKIKHPNCKFTALEARGPISLVFSVFSLALLLRVKNPKKLFSWMYHANAVSALAILLSFSKVRLLWGVRHSLDDYQGEKRSTKIAIQLGRIFKFVPHKVIYCSRKAQDQHEQFGYNSRQKSIYIPNGYSFGVLKPRRFNHNRIIIGAAGRYHAAKDYGTLFRAVKHLKKHNLNIDLRICGRGMDYENEELVNLIIDSGLSPSEVNLLGEVRAMAKFYEEIDLFILSSKTEGFPNVLAEAAAQGCAVFSTDVGDAPYIINNDEHIVAVKDPIALAECIYSFIKKPLVAKQQAMALTSQHVRNNFCIANIAKRFSEV
ncbi:glycosyl transferase [Pseudoalteromonas sp. S3260]|uniref:glycosyltransferase n=1 Tax=Pseudoalteromonas sp. S3260 TaxID=579534 RepID=UPI00110A2E14|nr:glycosyltransferase [Pseudoalteromonas sp. S3260]TMO99294.1 glycosyl transferase [Pseudoalteromonas sp. S3260]